MKKRHYNLIGHEVLFLEKPLQTEQHNMSLSLRFRLSLFITFVFLLVLTGCGFLVIENARKAVEEEVRSTASLTLRLVEIAFESAGGPLDDNVSTQFLESISKLESSRHLTIDMVQRTNFESHIPTLPMSELSADAPDWFVQLVKPIPVEYRRIFTGTTNPVEIIIRANPSDEITEVWEETKVTLGLMMLFFVLSISLIYYTLGSGLKPVGSLLKALDGIEQGNYSLRLPQFSTPEFSSISRQFNHMAEQLQTAQKDNRLLTQKSLAIQEKERRYLARELHDELGQSITAIKAVAASISQQATDDEELKQSTNAIIDVSNRMYDVAKSMMQRLRPTILDELGLVPTLQEMVDEWNARQEDIFCQFNFSGNLSDFDETFNINLFRIVQESLTNVAKHARASTVTIDLTCEPAQDHSGEERVLLSIKDDGIGFNNSTQGHGLGLLGIKERVASMDGILNINSHLNKGVLIEITFPVFYQDE